MDSCPKGDTLIVLGDFNATTDTDRWLWVVWFWSSWLWTKRCKLFNAPSFAKSRKPSIASSLFQKPHLNRWSFHSYSGSAGDENDNVGDCWILVQKNFVPPPSSPKPTNSLPVVIRGYGSSLVKWRPSNKFGWVSALFGTRTFLRSTSGRLLKVSANLTIQMILRNYEPTTRPPI